MATHRDTRKIGQIRKNPKVAVYYFDPKGISYVTVVGRASLVREVEKRRIYWKDDWRDFYSDTFRGKDYYLIRIEPLRVEVVSHQHGIANEADAWRPAIVEFVE
jgi:general stress protein 26